MKINITYLSEPEPEDRAAARRRLLFGGLLGCAIGGVGLWVGGTALMLALGAANVGLGAAWVVRALLDPMGRQRALPPGDES